MLIQRKLKATIIPREATMHRAEYMVMSTRLGSIRIMVLSFGGRSPTQKTGLHLSKYKVRVTPLYSPIHCSRMEGGSSSFPLSRSSEKCMDPSDRSRDRLIDTIIPRKLSIFIKLLLGPPHTRSGIIISGTRGRYRSVGRSTIYDPIMTFDAQQSRIME